MIVEAAFVMIADPVVTARSKQVEAAMIGALQAAQAEGVTDPEEQRRRMLAARDAVE